MKEQWNMEHGIFLFINLSLYKVILVLHRHLFDAHGCPAI